MVNLSEVSDVAKRGRARDCRRMATLIVRYFFHDLTPPELEEVESHLSGCPKCIGRYQALDATYGAPKRC
jgi:anti-sigma factor RsiW